MSIIRTARLEKGLTLANVAGALGVSTPYVSELERGKRSWHGWSRERISELAKVIGIDSRELLRLAAQHRLDGLLLPSEWSLAEEVAG